MSSPTLKPSRTCARVEFQYVQEEDKFLALFPHRYDYIYARHPEPGQTPDWQTEGRHPLSDRLLRQGSYLFGVRFGKETNYCLLDIDAGSLYHPQRDPLAISRILAALEPIGLVHAVTCTSSHSGGLHLYLPFIETQNTWKLAIAVTTLLESAGFRLTPGQLELFPNPRPYLVEGRLSLFNAHRLPLQAGSYLLNQDFQPIWSDQQTFVQHWWLAQQRNSVERKILDQLVKQFHRKRYHISGKAEKFLNDLNAEIETGWSGYGQTNRLLGRIAMRAYIFQHILSGNEPLEGQALIDEIVTIATSLPGYTEWCQHQHEIDQRAAEWARCIEASHYFHYGSANGKYKSKAQSDVPETLSWNQQQSQAARERVRQAIAHLLNHNTLPAGATARFHILTQYGIGGASLYRHRDLWHPTYLSIEPVENPPAPPTHQTSSQLECVEDAHNWLNSTSLLSDNGGNTPSGQGLTNYIHQDRQPIGSNGRSSQGSEQADHISDGSIQGNLGTQSVLFDLQSWFEAGREASLAAHQQARQIRQEAQQSSLVTRMQGYLESGDAILMAEALAWAEINPGVLQTECANSLLMAAADENKPVRHLIDMLAAISVLVEQLRLSKEEISNHLWCLFGKCSQALLEDMELAQWQIWLEEQLIIKDGGC